MMKRPHIRRAGARQDGVVLVVALVMLVIVGLASVAVMRNVMNNDVLADNNRRQNQALQAAQAALRYCEIQIVNATLVPTAPSASTDAEAWKLFTNWKSGTGGRQEVPTAFLVGEAANHRYDNGRAPKPQCMAQTRNLPNSGGSVVVVTARGFSDDYREDARTGRTQGGSVVWLQSILQLGSNS